MEGGASPSRLTLVQRLALKRLVKQARKRPDEPLSPADWESYWKFASQRSNRAIKRVLRAMPSTPRCGYCGAPFAGVGARIVGPLGYRPSRKNPNICAVCVELAPPGGMTMEVGVLFADLRGFTSASEQQTPHEMTTRLRRFYAHAEKVLFPEALIDKLIGDEVMALYVPPLTMSASDEVDDQVRQHIAHVMLEHARRATRARRLRLVWRTGFRSRYRARLRRGVHRQHRRHRSARLHGHRGRRQHGITTPVPRGRWRGRPLRAPGPLAPRACRRARERDAQGKAGAGRPSPRAMVR